MHVNLFVLIFVGLSMGHRLPRHAYICQNIQFMQRQKQNEPRRTTGPEWRAGFSHKSNEPGMSAIIWRVPISVLTLNNGGSVIRILLCHMPKKYKCNIMCKCNSILKILSIFEKKHKSLIQI